MSGSVTDVEKPSDSSHSWRLTRAMASTKVGDGLSYQAACVGSWGAVFATRERPGWSRRRDPADRRGAGDGQVGPLALGLHAQVGTHLLKGDLHCQRRTNHSRIWVGSAAGSVHSKAWVAKAPWGSRISTQRMRTGGLPERYQTAVWEVSSTVRVAPLYQATATLAQVAWGWSRRAFSEGSPRAFQRRAALLTRLTGRCWRIESGVQT